MNAPKILFAAALTLPPGASCTKYPIPIIGPIPGSLPVTPFQAWLDGAMSLGADSLELSLNPVGLYDRLRFPFLVNGFQSSRLPALTHARPAPTHA
jgi:hypothetical protein